MDNQTLDASTNCVVDEYRPSFKKDKLVN